MGRVVSQRCACAAEHKRWTAWPCQGVWMLLRVLAGGACVLRGTQSCAQGCQLGGRPPLHRHLLSSLQNLTKYYTRRTPPLFLCTLNGVLRCALMHAHGLRRSHVAGLVVLVAAPGGDI